MCDQFKAASKDHQLFISGVLLHLWWQIKVLQLQGKCTVNQTKFYPSRNSHSHSSFLTLVLDPFMDYSFCHTEHWLSEYIKQVWVSGVLHITVCCW